MVLLQKELIYCVLEKENRELIQPSQGKNSEMDIVSKTLQFTCSPTINCTTVDLASKVRSQCNIKALCKSGLKKFFFW